MTRRAAARQLMISPSSSIKGFQRFAATGRFAEKPGKKAWPSPLDGHADWLLALVAEEPDLTLAEIEARLLEECQFKTMDSLDFAIFPTP
jgi:transposase